MPQTKDLFALGDRLLCPSLKGYAEACISSHICNRNFSTLYHFAANYDARHLKDNVLRYAVHNLPYILERR